MATTTSAVTNCSLSTASEGAPAARASSSVNMTVAPSASDQAITRAASSAASGRS
jgi:hypothetical protein